MKWEDFIRKINPQFRSKRELLKELEETQTELQYHQKSRFSFITAKTEIKSEYLRLYKYQGTINVHDIRDPNCDIDQTIRNTISCNLACELHPQLTYSSYMDYSRNVIVFDSKMYYTFGQIPDEQSDSQE